MVMGTIEMKKVVTQERILKAARKAAGYFEKKHGEGEKVLDVAFAYEQMRYFANLRGTTMPKSDVDRFELELNLAGYSMSRPEELGSLLEYQQRGHKRLFRRNEQILNLQLRNNVSSLQPGTTVLGSMSLEHPVEIKGTFLQLTKADLEVLKDWKLKIFEFWHLFVMADPSMLMWKFNDRKVDCWQPSKIEEVLANLPLAEWAIAHQENFVSSTKSWELHLGLGRGAHRDHLDTKATWYCACSTKPEC